MRVIFLLIAILWFTKMHAQIASSDLQLIKQKETITANKKYIRKYSNLNKSKWQVYNPINLTFSGLMFFYQNVLSTQINAGCIYSPSCSEFSKQSIKKYGLIKGILLSADRVQRCNRITALGINIKQLNEQYKFPDSAELYHCKH
ncbi:MAG: membrane protein insertion efficiency factor YidD [Candidatus Methylacidiphilales bacterium]